MRCPPDEVNNSSRPIMSSNRSRLWCGAFTWLTDISLMMEPASPLQPLTNSLSLLWVYSCTASEIPALSNYLSPGLSVQAFICFAWLDHMRNSPEPYLADTRTSRCEGFYIIFYACCGAPLMLMPLIYNQWLSTLGVLLNTFVQPFNDTSNLTTPWVCPQHERAIISDP